MKQYPKNLAYKKYHKVNSNFFNLINQKQFFPMDGSFAIQSLQAGKLTFKQIESCRRTLRRGFGKSVKLWIRPFTSRPVTSKSIASRMGKGKGAISHWMAPVRKGQILFEVLYNSSSERAFMVLNKASTKLPIKVKIQKLKY